MNETKGLKQDLSPQVISLAREIDRLPPDQNYVIHLKKSSIKGQPWEVVISVENTLRVWKITREPRQTDGTSE